MYHDLWLRRSCWLGSVALVLVSGTLLQAQDKGRRIVIGGPSSEDIVYAYANDDGDSGPTYWIGVVCDQVDPALKAHLKLKDGGLLVRDVAKDAPAAKAGVKQHDILLAVGDKEITDIKGLVDAVEKSEGKEITLQVLRDGEKTTIKVTPTKRDKAARFEDLSADAKRWIELYRAGPDGWKLESVRPGVVGWRFQTGKHKLPKDMKVTITKEGESPAKIAVKQGDKSWEVTEDKLGDLPDDVRKHVAPMVRPGTGVFTQAAPAVPAAPPARVAPLPDFDVRRWQERLGGSERKLEKQIDELKKQIEDLRKAVDEMSKAKGGKQ